jgi:hypothetical protein
VLASSTGSTLLASAGLLRGEAATHWLAGTMLERYGVRPSAEPMIVDRGVITSSGRSSAFRAALVVAHAYGGPKLVADIRNAAVDARRPPTKRSWWRRFRDTVLRNWREPAPRATTAAELDDDDSDALDLGSIAPPARNGRWRYVPATSAAARSLAT